MGIQANKIGSNDEIDAVNVIIKLANEIGNELENPSILVDENTLSKFSIMTSIVRTLDRAVIDKVTTSMHVSPPKNPSRNDNIKLHAW
jgi:hypothetical protein